MKPYTVSVDIDLPRDRVIELFDNADNLYKWQPGLLRYEHLSGEPGQPGSKAKLVYKNGKREMELIETVTERNLPDEFNGGYAWKGGSNSLVNRFIELGPEKTRWESTCSYDMQNLMLKVMAFVMPGMFKKENQKWLNHFKEFCEKGTDVREAE